MTRHLSAEAIDPLLPAELPALPVGGTPSREPSGAGPEVGRLALLGDLSLSGRVRAGLDRGGSPDPLGATKALFGRCRLVLANLECSLVSTAAGADFTADPAAADALRRAGLTHVHLANNHALDHGGAGLAETLAAVECAGLTPLGASADLTAACAPVEALVGSSRIGLLGAGRTGRANPPSGPGLCRLEDGGLVEAVRRARHEVEVLIVSLHAGFMFLDVPSPELRELAHRLCDAGADLVVGHHPHVVQGIERAPSGGWIFYSLGNFLLDPHEGRLDHRVLEAEQRQGIVLLVEVAAGSIAGLTVLPTRITEGARVDWATGTAGEAILDRLTRVSELLGGDLPALFRRQRAERNTGTALRTLMGHLRHGEILALARLLARLRPAHLRMLWDRLRSSW